MANRMMEAMFAVILSTAVFGVSCFAPRRSGQCQPVAGYQAHWLLDLLVQDATFKKSALCHGLLCLFVFLCL